MYCSDSLFGNHAVIGHNHYIQVITHLAFFYLVVQVVDDVVDVTNCLFGASPSRTELMA